MNEPKIGHCIWNSPRCKHSAVFRAEFTGRDLYEVMRKVVDHIRTYIADDCFEKPEEDWYEEELDYNFWLPENVTQEERDEMGKKILNKVIGGNGDGRCDFIILLEWDGKKLITADPDIDNEQNWG